VTPYSMPRILLVVLSQGKDLQLDTSGRPRTVSKCKTRGVGFIKQSKLILYLLKPIISIRWPEAQSS
jgi:hypothetical protein